MKMKTARVSLLLFLSIAILLGLANASDKPEPVLDTDGDEVRTGVEYFVVSAIWGAGGGGLAIGRSSKQPCPEIVVQNGRDIDNGIPVIFYNAYSSDGVVRLDTDVNIEFLPIRDRLCLTSTVWKLDNYDESMGKWWVTTDGDIGNPGPSTLKNWFKIDKFTVIGYQFSFCPSSMKHNQDHRTSNGRQTRAAHSLTFNTEFKQFSLNQCTIHLNKGRGTLKDRRQRVKFTAEIKRNYKAHKKGKQCVYESYKIQRHQTWNFTSKLIKWNKELRGNGKYALAVVSC
ncbi:Proteinase inhibitor I3, Kunitz legume [Corchorus capsularis]|uniref:Proteinase inhibitor I3, Kunitz legume n=1 Tax=Corchorus capsularis TaxID=210143 RepID=A0A1R3HCS0_COCAP|nr:Proteinase inhibitor I3, Kunitz legume [Corchorus capsularis]